MSVLSTAMSDLVFYLNLEIYSEKFQNVTLSALCHKKFYISNVEIDDKIKARMLLNIAMFHCFKTLQGLL